MISGFYFLIHGCLWLYLATCNWWAAFWVDDVELKKNYGSFALGFSVLSLMGFISWLLFLFGW